MTQRQPGHYIYGIDHSLQVATGTRDLWSYKLPGTVLKVFLGRPQSSDANRMLAPCGPEPWRWRRGARVRPRPGPPGSGDGPAGALAARLGQGGARRRKKGKICDEPRVHHGQSLRACILSQLRTAASASPSLRLTAQQLCRSRRVRLATKPQLLSENALVLHRDAKWMHLRRRPHARTHAGLSSEYR